MDLEMITKVSDDGASLSTGHTGSESDGSSSWYDSSCDGRMCVVCTMTGGELLLRCELCEVAVHSFCVPTPLSLVYVREKTPWRCGKCFTDDETENYRRLPRIRRFRRNRSHASRLHDLLDLP
ncbi:hypothetical protein DIPPA_34164 [Diplonema papillatum]|nr:hypothetical protein DIPPA_34164 [Diplonema papillatum]